MTERTQMITNTTGVQCNHEAVVWWNNTIIKVRFTFPKANWWHSASMGPLKLGDDFVGSRLDEADSM
jgi:hypothetical protein